MLTNIVRLYVDMWRSVDIHVVGDIHVNILDGTSRHVFYEYVNMSFGNMSTGGIIMTCMLLFDVYVGKLMCQVETYDHQLNLFIMRDFSLRRFAAANVSHVNIRPLFPVSYTHLTLPTN